MPSIRTEFVNRVARVLNPTAESWCPLASSVLLAHMDAQIPLLYEGNLQAASDYFLLVGFAVNALAENPHGADTDELIDRVFQETRMMCNVAYHIAISPRARDLLCAYATYAFDEIRPLIDAPQS